jgi:hypothetical protein
MLNGVIPYDIILLVFESGGCGCVGNGTWKTKEGVEHQTYTCGITEIRSKSRH